MKYIGWFIVLIWLTGAVGLIDFDVCVKAFGKCPQTIVEHSSKKEMK